MAQAGLGGEPQVGGGLIRLCWDVAGKRCSGRGQRNKEIK